MLLENFIKARKRGVPLVAIQTVDPAQTRRQIVQEYKDTAALVSWDAVTGMAGMNAKGAQVLQEALSALEAEASITTNPAEALRAALNFAPNSIVIFVHLGMFAEMQTEAAALIIQGIWNLRDAYKSNFRTAVFLDPAFKLAQQIAQDVVSFDEPLPGDAELAEIVSRLLKAAKLTDIAGENMARAVDALRGLAAFAAEQVVALSLTAEGIDYDALWERKRKTVEQTPGLQVLKTKASFETVKGYDNVQGFLTRALKGNAAPKAVMFIDEIV